MPPACLPPCPGACPPDSKAGMVSKESRLRHVEGRVWHRQLESPVSSSHSLTGSAACTRARHDTEGSGLGLGWGVTRSVHEWHMNCDKTCAMPQVPSCASWVRCPLDAGSCAMLGRTCAMNLPLSHLLRRSWITSPPSVTTGQHGTDRAQATASAQAPPPMWPSRLMLSHSPMQLGSTAEDIPGSLWTCPLSWHPVSWHPSEGACTSHWFCVT